jgi:hypothetical protein
MLKLLEIDQFFGFKTDQRGENIFYIYPNNKKFTSIGQVHANVINQCRNGVPMCPMDAGRLQKFKHFDARKDALSSWFANLLQDSLLRLFAQWMSVGLEVQPVDLFLQRLEFD